MAIFVTPRDVIDCNQLQSLLHKHDNAVSFSPIHRTFRIGKKVAVWLFKDGVSYNPDVGTILDDGYGGNTVLTTNELAKRLAGY